MRMRIAPPPRRCEAPPTINSHHQRSLSLQVVGDVGGQETTRRLYQTLLRVGTRLCESLVDQSPATHTCSWPPSPREYPPPLASALQPAEGYSLGLLRPTLCRYTHGTHPPNNKINTTRTGFVHTKQLLTLKSLKTVTSTAQVHRPSYHGRAIG